MAAAGVTAACMLVQNVALRYDPGVKAPAPDRRPAPIGRCGQDGVAMPPLPSEDEIESAAAAAALRQDRIGIEGAWALMRERYPGNSAGYLQAGIYLRDREDFAEADAIFERGLALLGEVRGLLIHHAWSAYYRADWPLALARWQRVIGHNADDPAGHVGTVGHIHIGSGAILTAKSGVTKDVPEGQTWRGAPARPIKEQMAMEAYLQQLPDLARRLKVLESKKNKAVPAPSPKKKKSR